MRVLPVLVAILFSFVGLLQKAEAQQGGKPKPPNIIFILADDLGYGDLGCYGQKKIATPNLDQLAAEGMRFTQFYAGATVCAPSRCVLMSGKHTGHCAVRGNGKPKAQMIPPTETTVAEALKQAGYETALIGKWGLGEPVNAEEGLPTRNGFDYSFGYLNQHHAHNYYPEILWSNETPLKLNNVVYKTLEGAWGAAGWATERVDYSHDLFMHQAYAYVDQRNPQSKPFFLYLSLTIPHANNEGTRGTGNGQDVPDLGAYADKDWTEPNKGQAAMISRMDADIGKLREHLRQNRLDDNTILIFSSDNGHHKEGGNDPEFFDANGPLRGMKRDLYEGGIRVPTIACWPGKIKAGTTSDHIGYFGDFFATFCDLANTETPSGLDSISIAPTLFGDGTQQKHKALYWEFYEQGSKQAVRMGDWKAIRMPMFTGEVELYNLSNDLGETTNLAQQHPEVVEQAIELMEQEHVDNPLWQIRGKKKKK